MKTIIAKRLLNSGFTNFYRNIWLSLAATSIMVITLFIISTILLLYTLTALSLNSIKDKVGISAYFKNEVSDKEIQNVVAELQLMPQIKSVEFIPKTVARNKFIEAHKDEPLLLETLNEFNSDENPLPNSLAIKAYNLTDYATISKTLQSDRYMPFFDRIRDDSKVIDRLFKITDAITKIGILLTLIFILVTILVMFNTIRLTIYNRRGEIEIMRLVGATNWYTRGPFIIEGLLYGLIATIVSSGLMLLLMYFMTAKIEAFLSLSNLGGSLIKGVFFKTLLVDLVVSLILGTVASTVAIRRYLRV